MADKGLYETDYSTEKSAVCLWESGRMKQLRQMVQDIAYILSLVWGISKIKVLLGIGIALMQAMLDFTNEIYFLRITVQIIEEGGTFNKLFKFVLLVLLFNTIRGLLNAWFYYYYNELLNEKVETGFTTLLFKKAMEIDYAKYEQTEFQNKITRITNLVRSVPIMTVDIISTFISSIIFIATVFLYICTIDSFLLVFTLCPLIANVFWRRATVLNHKIEKEKVPYDRSISHVHARYCSKEAAKEIRMTNIKNVLDVKYTNAICQVISVIHKYRKPLAINNGLGTFVASFLAFICGNIYAIYRFAIKYDLMLSDFSVLTSAVISLNNRTNRLISTYTKAQELSLNISDIREFLATQGKKSTGLLTPASLLESLEFRHVSFRYPLSDTDVLHDINLTITRGEKVALVGLNGAGKTTILKLLLRLYEPTEGVILYNGININSYDIDQYRNMFSTVFQDFNIFALSLAENITMSAGILNRALLLESLKITNLEHLVKDLAQGENTQITRQFDKDGAVLSTGMEQKLAISRMYYKQANIALLDEPTAAIDPISEYQLYSAIMAAIESKTAIFISHRLSVATLMDKIYVIANGRISEYGNHSELMLRHGEYAEMYNTQAEKYRTEVKTNEGINATE